MKRVLAIFAVIMCLAGCMVPMAFADEIMAASCDVRVAGFEHGLSTLRPGASYSSGFYGGLVLHGDIVCNSATVSDVVWVNDGSSTGYFTVVYTITIDAVSAADIIGKPIVSVPLDWGSGSVRYEWQVSPDMNMRMEDATDDMRMHSLMPGGGQFYVDGTDQTMMTFVVSGYEDVETITEIKIGLKVWDAEASIITPIASGGKGFGDWLTHLFRVVSAGGGIILTSFSMIMNTAIIKPIIWITGSTLLAAVIISVVR